MPSPVVLDSAGVTVVANDPHRPVWSEETAWRLASPPAVQVGNVPGDPGQQLVAVEHARRLPDGRIAVANAGLGDVRVFDAEGRHLLTLGSASGPFPWTSRPVRVYEHSGDSLLVALADGALVVFDREGRLARTFRPASRDPAVGRLELAGRMGRGGLLLRGDLPFDSTGEGVQRHRFRAEWWDVAGTLRGGFGDLAGRSELVGEEVLVFAPGGYAAAGDSTLWHGDAASFEVREILPGGRTHRVVRLGVPADRVTGVDTMAFRQAAQAQLVRSVGPDSADATLARYRYPSTLPAYDAILVDAPGNVWVRHYQWFDLGADKRWSVFDPDGPYLGDVLTPGILEIHQVGEDFVLGRMAASTGREAVYLYRLEKPGVDRGGH